MPPNAKATNSSTPIRLELEREVEDGTYGSMDPYLIESLIDGAEGGSTIATTGIGMKRDEDTTATPTSAGPHGEDKSIGWLGAFAIGVNSLCGPAILQLPYQFQQSGIIPTTGCLIVVGALAYFVTMHMSNVVSKVPGNSLFEKSVEFSDPFETFWSHRAFLACQLVFYLCTVSLNIAAIVDTAEVVDSFLGHTIGSRALAADRLFFFDDGGGDGTNIQEWQHGPCTLEVVRTGLCEPFAGVDSDGIEYSEYLITSGYIIALLFFLPICLMNLKDNTNWQIFAFLVTATVSTIFVISFTNQGLSMESVTWWGEDYSGLLGTILFNYGLVLAMPAVLSAKSPSVDTKVVVQGSTVLTTIIYVLTGLLGAMSMPNVNINMLKPMVSGAYGPTLQWAGWFFAFFIIGLDIPLFSVLTRYNLVSIGLLSEFTANLWVVYIPWGISWLFYQGDAIAELLSWGGVLFTSAAAFLLPLYLALRVLVQYPEAKGSIDVYGGFVQSVEAKRKSLYLLLLLAGVSVCLGIYGQAQYDIMMNHEVKHNLKMQARHKKYLRDTGNLRTFENEI